MNERAAGAFEVRQYSGATLALRDPGREFGALRDHAVKTTHGLQCSHCGGRVLTELHERIAA